MRPIRIAFIRDPDSTSVEVRVISDYIEYKTQCERILILLLIMALEFNGIITVNAEETFPELKENEKVAVQTLLFFDNKKHIDEFIQFIIEASLL